MLVADKENYMPPSGFSKQAVNGALVFIKTCYQDLLKEVKEGKHKDFESAIDYEIGQIDKALMKLHIDHEGSLTERN